MRSERAYKMRLEGLPIERIAEMLGDSVEDVRKMMRRKLKKEVENQETEEGTRALELSRLDFLVNQLMARINDDALDNKAIELLLKCQQRRAALMGIDLGKGEINITEVSDADIKNQVLSILNPDLSGEFEPKTDKLSNIA